MDLTSILGPVIALGMIITGMLLEGGHLSQLWAHTAIMIVFGGTLGALMVAYPLPDMIGAVKALGIWLKNPSADPEQILKDIIDLAQTARKESILALEKKRDSIAFEPLRTAIGLAVDGTDPNVIRDTLETAAHVVFEEAEVAVKFWEDFGAICPTIGILGAVLGLQHVMSVLDQPEKIGPGIAVAFVATLYGVGAANIVGIPVGKKLKRKAIIEGHARAMVVIGVDGILSGLNPKIIETKLSVFVHNAGGEAAH
ncbi:MAG: MotA/TolQ/ExbB proton channel family protein [Proteobacteria bacterium]|nr:MotA/TolQ/ExbB proton channel family protein [Pseudomonadota bacterium]